MSLPIYLDYAATTPVDPAVADKMMQYLTPQVISATPRRALTPLVGKRKPQ